MMRGGPVGRVKDDRGFTLVDVLFAIALIGLLVSLAIPGLMRARGAAHSSSALGTLRVINSAQLSYAITCGLGFYAPDFPALTAPPVGSPEAFLAPEIASGPTFVRSGYIFSMAGTPLAGAPPTCNGLAGGQSTAGYALVADQIEVTPGSGRFFGSNADGLIYEDTGSLAPSMPESGVPPSGMPLH